MRAKVEIFDEHTGLVICKERVFPPFMEEYDPITQTWHYEFRVKAMVMASLYEDLLDKGISSEMNADNWRDHRSEPIDIKDSPCKLVQSVREATDEEIQEVINGNVTNN